MVGMKKESIFYQTLKGFNERLFIVFIVIDRIYLFHID